MKNEVPIELFEEWRNFWENLIFMEGKKTLNQYRKIKEKCIKEGLDDLILQELIFEELKNDINN